MDLIERLLDFDYWATAQLLEVSGRLSDEQLDREFDIGHRTVRATWVHVVWNIPFWIGLMTGNPISDEPDRREWSIAEITAFYEDAFATFAALARQLRDEGRLEETYVDHWNVKKSMSGTILTVILHASEHRAEVSHMLTRLGVEHVPEVDLGARDYELLNT
jgi:uncharacterized damage-inducible protein DinB